MSADEPERGRGWATLYTDGAARGNPGPAGAGAHLEDARGRCLAEVSRYLGETTNNVAEYSALLVGLERARELGIMELEVRADSQLMVRQLRGEYRVRHPGLQPLYRRALELARDFRSIRYVHIPREDNGAADRLANLAIDEQSPGRGPSSA